VFVSRRGKGGKCTSRGEQSERQGTHRKKKHGGGLCKKKKKKEIPLALTTMRKTAAKKKRGGFKKKGSLTERHEGVWGGGRGGQRKRGRGESLFLIEMGEGKSRNL